MLMHIRCAIRHLLKSPGFTIVAILILGLGIGANTTIFSLIGAVLLKPLPYPQAGQLVRVFQPLRNLDRFPVTYPDYQDFNANQHTFQSLAAALFDDLDLTGQGDPARVHCAYVTGGFFKTLGGALVFGRSFNEVEDGPSGSSVVLLSERLWRDRFQADPQIIGKNLTLTGRSFQVIGVTPVQNGELSPIDIFAPLNQDPDWQHLKSDRSSHAFACFGRLKENVTPQQAQAELEVVSKNLAVQYPDTHAALTVRVVPLLTSIVAGYASTLWILAGAVVLLLAIACANIANLQFTRGLERRKELAVRVALGATRTDLVKQMFFENALLTFIGGCLGVLIADWSIRGLKVFGPQNMPRLQDVQLDGVGLVFALGATLLTSIASGLLPALGLSRTNVVLRAEARKGYTHQLRHSVLLICQVALSLVLLFGAALMARSFQAIQNIPLGFNPKNLLTADIYLPRSRYPTQSQCKAFFDSLQAKLKNQPGIKSVGMDDDLPFEFGARNMGPFGVAGRAQPDKAHRPRTEIELVSPDYFRTLEINLLKGREFDAHDQYDDNRVVIISQTVADRYFHSQDPIGKQIYDFSEIQGLKRSYYTIIGVVQTVYHRTPDAQGEQSDMQIYFPYGQHRPYLPPPDNYLAVALRTTGDPGSYAPALRKVVTSIDADLPLANVTTFESLFADSLMTRRLALLSIESFSVAALLLVAIGTYGVLAYSVGRRTAEIGIRIALGAQSSNIFRLIIGQGLRLVAIGVLAGSLCALVAARFLGSILYGVTAADPTALAASFVVLGVAAIVACLLPALRAIRVSPLTAIRFDANG